MGKHSKVSSSTKWRLGVNVVLRLMEYIQEQQPNQFPVTTRTWILSAEQYRYPNEKMPTIGTQVKKWW